jgi:hypothetical protein
MRACVCVNISGSLFYFRIENVLLQRFLMQPVAHSCVCACLCDRQRLKWKFYYMKPLGAEYQHPSSSRSAECLKYRNFALIFHI